MSDGLTEWTRSVLSDPTVAGAPTESRRRAGTRQRVVEVTDASGQRWFVKRVATLRGWRAEVHAYRRWVPQLGDRAPLLHAAHKPSRTLILSALPGDWPPHGDVGSLRQAGVLLRCLHEAEPAHGEPVYDDPDAISSRLNELLSRNQGLLAEQEVAFLARCGERASNLPPAPVVASHGDYKRHNWLLDDAGVLRVIDFGEAALRRAAFDFAGMFFGSWWNQPHLAAAFFRGYGRRPTPDEMAFIQCRLTVMAVANICFGHNRGHPKAEVLGRSRLANLMAGHQVKVRRRRRPRLAR